MSTQIATPSPDPSRKQSRRQQQPTYASDGGVQHQAKRQAQNAASDKNDVQHNTAGRKREKKPKQQNPQTTNSPAPFPNYDGALSPRPSPAQARINYAQSPPPVVSTPLKQAYAGPTFHASPAASSLPKPKFFSKSVPSTTPSSSLQARFDADPNKDQSQTPSPGSEGLLEPVPPRPHQTPIAREESPLDLFFNAHRAEQARRDSGTLSPHAAATRSTPTLLSPSSARPTPATLPSTAHSQRPTPNPTPSNKEMFQMEVDGTVEPEADYESFDYDSAQHHAPGHSIPFSDRLRGYNGTSSPVGAAQRPAMHSGQQYFTPPPQQQQQRPLPDRDHHLNELHRQAQSQALKRMLMLQSDGDAPAQGSLAEARHARQVSAPVELPAEAIHWSLSAAHAAPQTNGYAPQTAGYTSHANGYASHGHEHGHGQSQTQRNGILTDVQSMEADLKRMLKLG